MKRKQSKFNVIISKINNGIKISDKEYRIIYKKISTSNRKMRVVHKALYDNFILENNSKGHKKSKLFKKFYTSMQRRLPEFMGQDAVYKDLRAANVEVALGVDVGTYRGGALRPLADYISTKGFLKQLKSTWDQANQYADEEDSRVKGRHVEEAIRHMLDNNPHIKRKKKYSKDHEKKTIVHQKVINEKHASQLKTIRALIERASSDALSRAIKLLKEEVSHAINKQ